MYAYCLFMKYEVMDKSSVSVWLVLIQSKIYEFVYLSDLNLPYLLI